MSADLVPFESFNTNLIDARRAEVGADAHAVRAIFRHRIDWHWLQTGELEAVLTVSLPDGHEMRFRAKCDPHEVATALASLRPEIGGFSLGGLWKGIKKITKAVATSKVFKLAGTAIAMAAPALGPIAPAALAAAAGMKGATALLAARTHAAKGNHEAAKKLVAYASKAAQAAATIAPPKAARHAANPAAAAHKTHLNSQRATSAKLYRLMLQPA